jgi:hypothetical protein
VYQATLCRQAGKKRQPRNKFSARMLTDVGTKDRKCEACVAAARSRHAGPSTADGFLCHGAKCKGKRRQPRSQFSGKQIRQGGAHKVCRTCAAVVDKAALDGGTPGNSCLVHTVSSSVCSAFVQLSFSFRRVPDQLSGCCSLPACRDGLSWVARDALLHLCLDFHRGADLFHGLPETCVS